eukprot:gene13874-4825_t
MFDERCKEELDHLALEMANYLKFYADKVIPSLEERKAAFLETLTNKDPKVTIEGEAEVGCQDNGEVAQGRRDCSKRYSVSASEGGGGLLSILNKGIDFAKSQLRKGYETFSHVSGGTEDTGFTFLEPEPEGQEPSEIQPADLQSSENVECDDSIDGDDSNDGDDEDTECSFRAIEIKRRSLSFAPKIVRGGFFGKGEDCILLMYEDSFSQNTINGRNGSNACSFIAVIFAFLFLKEKIEVGPFEEQIQKKFNEILYEAMAKGNEIYDKCRRSLPHRYCSITEVSESMTELLPFTVKEEKPVSVKNEHFMSTLRGQLEFLMFFKKPFAIVFVCNEKSSVFCSDGKKIAFVDTHSHFYGGTAGGAIHICAEKELDTFIYWVAEVMELPDNVYGNLTFLRFH